MSEDLLLMLELTNVDDVDIAMGGDLSSIDIQSFDPSDGDEQILRAVDFMATGQGTPREEEPIL